MLVQCSREDRHEGSQETEAALAGLSGLVPHLFMEGLHDTRDLGVEQRERTGGEGERRREGGTL